MNAKLVDTVRFKHKSYSAGTQVTILSNLVHDGVFLARFPEGEETYLSAWRVDNPPKRGPVQNPTEPGDWGNAR
jgi:hypothetical protein